MKKFGSLLLSIVLLVSLVSVIFVGCSKSNDTPNEDTTAAQGELSGGWTANAEFEGVSIPDDAKAALEKATAEMTGATYEAVAYLGSQVVSGTNYAFLCNITTVTAEPVTTLNVVAVYNDLDGNCSITDTKEVNIADYTEDKQIDFEQLDGAYDVSTATGAKLSDDVQKAYDKATEGLTGVSYEPLAQLGSQVVSGSNYAILCKATSVTAEPVSALAVMVVYADLEGNAEISTICPFNA